MNHRHDTLPFPHEVRQKVYAQVINSCLAPSTHLLDREGLDSISNLLYVNKTTFLEFSKLLFATTIFNGTERRNFTVTDGLDNPIRAHGNLQAVVIFPGRDEPSVLPAVHERLARKLLATLCLGKLKTSVEYLLPDNREVTFIDCAGGKVESIAITKGIPEHIASHVQLDKLVKLEAFRYSSEEYNVWTFETADKTWFLTSISHTVTGFIAVVGHVARLQDLWVKVDDAAILKAREQEAINLREHTLYEKNYKNPLPGFVKDFEERRQREMRWPWTRWLQGKEAGKKSKPRKGKGKSIGGGGGEADATCKANEIATADIDHDELPLTGAEENGDKAEVGETQTTGGADKTVTFVEAEHNVVEAETTKDDPIERVETTTTEAQPKSNSFAHKSKKSFRFGKQKPALEAETKKQHKLRKNKFKQKSGPVTTVENDAEPDTCEKGVVQMKNLIAQHFAVAEAEGSAKAGGAAVQEFVAAKLPKFAHA
jgi:hypothetical protein